MGGLWIGDGIGLLGVVWLAVHGHQALTNAGRGTLLDWGPLQPKSARVRTVLGLIVTPIAAMLAGVLEFVVLGVTQFPLLAMGSLPS